MPPPQSGQKSALKITRVTVQPSGKIDVSTDGAATFTAMLNPSDVSHDRVIAYNGQQSLGQLGSEMKFRAVGPDRISFALLFDATGVVAPATFADSQKDVGTWLKQLNRVVYDYEGAHHQPGHVRVLWGSLILFGRMESMSTNYTLFKPNGDPLRAKVSLKFVGFISKKQASLVANRSSPDLSHLVEVREGDTLPLLCSRIYGDPSYYPDVARFNGLPGFRRLVPGQQLRFPPLV
jgi:hypothetical protein